MPRYDWEGVNKGKDMGYGNIKVWLNGNPNTNKECFCSICGMWNDIFDKPNWKDLLRDNICPKCSKKVNEKRFV